ncbi:hypothetical protein UFOVP369_32 [uncultured Caudovirales phage]|uniref:Portal protein n=1 Tax=uncultured Caudovirales phage TaxID=2100421 RepID=A0A6J7WXT0_9CAUD|nr:hypothetical protein UFOVP369_32 [uncultured Caudovirales phage]
MAQNKLVDWINDNIEDWRLHRDTNYLSVWKEYERLWRGEWAAEDRLRDSERSRITSPALQQAIENHTAEIEEAIFGQGDHLFDIEDDMDDPNSKDIEYLKKYMKENFKKTKLRKAVGDVCLLASIYGTGIGEITIKKAKELVPATRPMPDVNARAIGVETKEKVNIVLKPISPQNFLIDPTATSIEDALGVAIEEFVSAHKVAENVKAGVYKDTDLEDDATPDSDLEFSWIDEEYNDDKVKVLRYYGLVPSKLLDNQGEDDVEEIFKENKNSDKSELMEEYGDLVEAIVVIGNEQFLLKAERSPYMMKDRPVIAYQDDTVPNRFWGRGVAEKGYNMQKAIDAQLRSHLDSLALTTVPMMGMDATRLPRGSKFEIRPGKSILTNGNPGEILMPFKFGQTDGSNIQTAQAFETMLLQATGTLDTQSTQTQPAGGELSITLSSILKKNKRTLVNFQDQFLIPFIEKSAWRFMQFDPEHFPVQDWKFIPSSTLGMLAREVEQMQFINLMKTLGPDSPLVPILMKGIIGTSSLANREELLANLEESMKPTPEQQQAQQMQMQLQAGLVQSQINEFNSRAQKQSAEAQQTNVETQFIPDETKAKLAMALSNNLDAGSADDKEFERRAKVAELLIKEKNVDLKAKDMEQNKQIVMMQMQKNLTK